MAEVSCPVIVGREAERARLHGLAGRARSGAGAVAFVVGDAGTGKSRLVADLAAYAAERGMGVVTGRAVARGSAAYHAWAGVLLPVTRDAAVLADPALRGWLGALRAVLPGVGGLEAVTARMSSIAAAEAVLRLLRVVAGSRGLLVVLEDLHWADPDTVGVLEYLADSLAREPILCVATSRPDRGTAAVELSRRLRRAGAAPVLSLSGLADDEVAEMVRACVVDPSAELLARAQRGSDGIPLLVEGLVMAAGTPATLAETVGARLAELGEPGRRVLTAAALLGRGLDWRLLAASADVAAAEVRECLAAAVAAGLLVSEDGGLAFRHELVRDAVLEASLPPERAPLAEAAFAAVVAAHPEVEGPWADVAAELALAAGDRDRAARLRIASGRASLARGALATAVVTLRQAVELLPDGPRRAEADLLLLEAMAYAGRFDEAWQVGGRLTHELAARGADPADRAAAHLLICGAAVAATRWHVAEAESRAAHLLLDDGDPRALAELLLLDAEIAIGGHDARTAHALASRVRDVPGIGPPARCHALEIIGRTSRVHDSAAARAVFEQALHHAEEAGLPVWRLRALHQIGTIDMFERCGRRRLEEARRVARDIGAVSTVAELGLQLCAVEHGRFDLDRAVANAGEAYELADRLGLTEVRHKALLFLSAVHALRGEWEQARDYHDRSMTGRTHDSYTLSFGLGGFGLGELLEGRWDAARRHLSEAVALLDPLPGVEPATFRAAWPLLLAVGRDERAPAATADALRRGVAVFGVNRGLIGYADAVVRGGAGDASGADAAARAADAHFANAELWQHVARATVADAAERDGWGDPRAWREAARAPLRSRGLARFVDRTIPDPVVPTGPVPGLTARERDVLSLVAQGLANRDMDTGCPSPPAPSRSTSKACSARHRRGHARISPSSRAGTRPDPRATT